MWRADAAEVRAFKEEGVFTTQDSLACGCIYGRIVVGIAQQGDGQQAGNVGVIMVDLNS